MIDLKRGSKIIGQWGGRGIVLLRWATQVILGYGNSHWRDCKGDQILSNGMSKQKLLFYAYRNASSDIIYI